LRNCRVFEQKIRRSYRHPDMAVVFPLGTIGLNSDDSRRSNAQVSGLTPIYILRRSRFLQICFVDNQRQRWMESSLYRNSGALLWAEYYSEQDGEIVREHIPW
jgi:hypothetical protein